MIWQLKDRFPLERHRAKMLGGLLARLAAKLAAYTCGQLLNLKRGRPLRHLADLLVREVAQQTSKGTLDCIGAFSYTGFRDDLANVTVPTLLIHGDSDAIVAFEVSGQRSPEAFADGSLP